MILSASGFRKVFAPSGLETDSSKEISRSDALICACAARAFFENKLKKGSRVLLGRDSRPTGKAICQILGSALIQLGADVKYIGICGVDQLLCYSRRPEFNAFAYVSASHNPIGHNGFKLGYAGGVYSKEEVTPVIETMKKLLENPEVCEELYKKTCETCLEEDALLKKESFDDYLKFTLDSNPSSESNIGVVIDYNGSARSISIDETLLKGLGMKVSVVNNTPGEIVHEIIPEGENLNTCLELLKKKHAEDPDYVIGYMPDCDGDRGNIVYIDENSQARIMESQTVFALCVYSMLLKCSKRGDENLAVAVNGPTSMRINEIASMFNAKVFRAEVGESNVVRLADSLREKGYNVPILGEGPNGGNITYPSRARDPLSTVLCLSSILRELDLSTILSDLPVYTSTGTTSPQAVLHLETDNYKLLKKYYEDAFDMEFEKNKSKFNRPNVKYREIQTDGIAERCERGNGDRGGLKMVFSSEGKDFAFIWMRPSGTEPLFRILADVKGNDRELHDFLINWQRKMILSSQEKVLQ